jgi:hypothetical protein
MPGGSNGSGAALVRRQLTPGLTSSLPGTAGLPPFIFFSTSYAELDSAVRRSETGSDTRGNHHFRPAWAGAVASAKTGRRVLIGVGRPQRP